MDTKSIIEKLKSGDMEDSRELSNFLVALSASRGDATNFETELQIESDKAWRRLKEIPRENGKEKTDTYVDREWTSTPEWKAWKIAKNQNEAMEDVILSLKKKLSTINF